jgi:integrase
MNEAQAKQARAKHNPDNLYQREGIWWIRYNLSGRKIRRSLGTPSLREARRLRDQILAKRTAAARFGIEAPEPRKEHTFADVVKAWLQSRRAGELRANTIRDGETMAKRWLLPELGDRLVSEITVEDVERFISHLRTTRSTATGRRLSRDHVAKLTKYLGAIFRFALKRRMHHGANPYDQLDRRPTAGPGRHVFLTEDEARRLLDRFTGETYYKIGLALATGLRWGEIHGLAWADVELGENPRLTIRRSWQGEPKTKNSAATIPISADAAAFLRRWKAEQGDAVYVFPDLEGKLRKRADRREERLLVQAGREAQITARVSPHVFRHTFATWTCERTEDPRKLQRLMRHGSIKTSMGYVHAHADLTEVIDKLPALSQARLQAV